MLRMLTAPALANLFAPLTRQRATVFMLHRFRNPDLGVEGHDPAGLRQILAYLRKEGYELAALEDVFRRLAGSGPTLERTVAFTLDDGYADQADTAGPVFAEFDCPATTFLTSGFLDGKLWMWWDRVEYIFRRTDRSQLSVEFAEDRWSAKWRNPEERDRANQEFVQRCKELRDVDKAPTIERLAEAAEVEVPSRPPEAYAPMTWDNVREWERRGLRYGPHTVTHCILSRTDDDQSREEIETSWQRLCAEAQEPVPIFCYPNGEPRDFGAREISTLSELGLLAAVVGTPGYAASSAFQRGGEAAFTVRRFAYQDSLPHVIQCASGVERFKELVRGGASA
jgi:peptidoglycan/xylan/chitin deacetylase (PgdA/CDA1 family)